MNFKLVLQINSENKKLKEKFNGRIVKGKTFLPIIVNTRSHKFNLEGYPKGRLVIEAWEQGGSANGFGQAQLVCGKDGMPMKPVFIRGKGHLVNDRHAFFDISLSKGLSIIRLTVMDGKYHLYVVSILGYLKITEAEFELLTDTENFMFSTRNEFTDWMKDIPMNMSQYSNAIDAALTKSETINCKAPIYVK